MLGGGTAGITGAATAAALGKSVTLVDKHYELGGAGINTGTVPSKTLRETALTLSGARSRNIHGVDLSLRREATVNDFMRHERAVKASMNSMLTQQLVRSGADVYRGAGVFEDAHTIRVRMSDTPVGSTSSDVLLGAARVLVATGSSPVRPKIFPFDSPGIYDSDTILDLNRLPKSIAVVGAGTVGCEYACIFAALHIDVHIVDGRKRVLPFLDAEIGSVLTTAMERSRITLHLQDEVLSCHAAKDDGVTLMLASGGSLVVDAALIAAGRKSNTEWLNLAAAGVTSGQGGLIEVDKHFQTKAPHVYAAGDVVGPPALVSTGMEQARRAVKHAFGQPMSEAPALLPTGVYTIPEIGMIGETEDKLKQEGTDYVVGRASYDRNARGKIIGDADGMLKLLFRRSDLKLLGVHAIGEQATELVHVGLIALLVDSTAHIFDDACFNLPTLGHMYKTAALHAISGSVSHYASR